MFSEIYIFFTYIICAGVGGVKPWAAELAGQHHLCAGDRGGAGGGVVRRAVEDAGGPGAARHRGEAQAAADPQRGLQTKPAQRDLGRRR